MARITGHTRHAARLRFMVGPASEREVTQALFAAGNLIEVEAELSITAGSISGKGHVPSAPGEPPNADTRFLDTHIQTIPAGPLKVEVEATAPYAAALEVGTSRMAARPFMAPAAEKHHDDAQRLVSDAVSKIIRKG